MLDYKKNRIDYGQQLSPPEGYKLDYAIATTYSLDLHALLCIPVALFYAKNMDGQPSETRMDILDAIQKTGDKVKVYCQKGKVKVPNTHNRIISFIDDCVSEVLPTEPFGSFHPKVWVMRFVAKNQPTIYRFFILSRNLTFDRSWDLAFHMEGIVSEEVQPKNKPLVDFVNYLKKQEDFSNSTRFIDELATVAFEYPEEIDSVEFIPMGIPGHKDRLSMDFGRLLIISPFVQANALKWIKKESRGKRYLFARREELSKLPEGALKGYEPYFLSQSIVDGEDYWEEGADDEIKEQNLHAKLFIGQKDLYVTWYLGSANCSLAAMDRNQEFMVKLSTANRAYGIGNIKKTLFGEDQNFFERFDKPADWEADAEPDYGQEIRQGTYYFTKFMDEGGIEGGCVEIDPEKKQFNLNYTLRKSIPNQLDDFEFKFSCYGRDTYIQLSNDQKEYVFDRINLENLSPFLKWEMIHKASGQVKKFLLKMPIVLPRERKDAIFRSIIENKEKFFQFLQFLLGRESSHTELISGLQRIETGNGEGQIWSQDTPILEELLIMVSREPDRIKNIDAIIEKLDSQDENSPVPNEFREFWAIFKPFAQNE
jgi:HKD family nuclease